MNVDVCFFVLRLFGVVFFFVSYLRTMDTMDTLHTSTSTMVLKKHPSFFSLSFFPSLFVCVDNHS